MASIVEICTCLSIFSVQANRKFLSFYERIVFQSFLCHSFQKSATPLRSRILRILFDNTYAKRKNFICITNIRNFYINLFFLPSGICCRDSTPNFASGWEVGSVKIVAGDSFNFDFLNFVNQYCWQQLFFFGHSFQHLLVWCQFNFIFLGFLPIVNQAFWEFENHDSLKF